MSDHRHIRSALPPIRGPVCEGFRTNVACFSAAWLRASFFPCAVASLLTLLTASVLIASDDGEKTVHISVSPAALPKPALKYQLLPELSEQRPGNSVLGYLQCFMEHHYFFFGKKATEQRELWGTMPLRQLPVKELRSYGGWALEQADRAARMQTTEWQVLSRLKTKGMDTRLPDIQQLRYLALALKVRFRGEIADRRFDAAIRTAKTLFALARDLGEHPTLLGNLVGMHAAHQALAPLQEMVQQPASPNLFWALTDLPRPLVDSRAAAQGEMLTWSMELKAIDDLRPMTEQEIEAVVARLDKILASNARRERNRLAQQWLKRNMGDPTRVQAARRRLTQAGLPENDVRKFPSPQVILLDEKLAAQELLHDILKWRQLPTWKALPAWDAIERRAKRTDRLLVPSIASMIRVWRLQVLTQQRVAILQHIEALRHHAATNGGNFPKKLDEIALPLPVDPMTGRPLRYSLKGRRAILRVEAVPGMERFPMWAARYEVTLVGS